MKKIVILFSVIAIASSKLLPAKQAQGISPSLVGGSLASTGQFPYQVAILMSTADDSEICGGTLIKHKWVLTAASCLHMGFSNYTLVFGSANFLLDEPVFISNSIPSLNLKIHPDYNKDTNVNNIALIYVEDMPANLTDSKYVGAIDLPTESEASTNLTGQDTVISGYGSLYGEEIFSGFFVQYTTFKIASNDVCKNFGSYNVTNSTLCIGTSNGISPCGDGGSPMTIKIGSKKVLAGIVGPNIDNCTLGYPVAGESVFYHRKWIEETSGSLTVGLSFSLLALMIMMVLKN